MECKTKVTHTTWHIIRLGLHRMGSKNSHLPRHLCRFSVWFQCSCASRNSSILRAVLIWPEVIDLPTPRATRYAVKSTNCWASLYLFNLRSYKRDVVKSFVVKNCGTFDWKKKWAESSSKGYRRHVLHQQKLQKKECHQQSRLAISASLPIA